jgi:L-lactate dehydrogenase complex protein LldG
VSAELVARYVANAERAGFTVHPGRVPQIPGAEVSEAAYGLADTGSVVLLASPEEPRARSLLPDVHVTRLREDRLLPGLEELFVALGADLPSSVAIVSGPSRSADIEQRLTVGVHGPAEVHVVLLGGLDETQRVPPAHAARPRMRRPQSAP